MQAEPARADQQRLHDHQRHPGGEDAAVQIEVAEPGQAIVAQVQAAFGVDEAQRGTLPVVGNSQRLEQVFLAVVVDILSRFFLEDVGEKFAGAAAVVEDSAGRVSHGLVYDVLHPVVDGLHEAGVATRVVVGDVFVPIQAGGHGEDMA